MEKICGLKLPTFIIVWGYLMSIISVIFLIITIILIVDEVFLDDLSSDPVKGLAGKFPFPTFNF